MQGNLFCPESWKGRDKKMRRGTIKVPNKEELPVNFMDDFMHYAFLKLNECKENFREIKNIRLEEK